MEKVKSDFMERLSDGEPFWVALPAMTIKQLPVGLISATMDAGGIAVLKGRDLKLHKARFHGNSKPQNNQSLQPTRGKPSG
jgi:hypothetical protein